MKTLRGLQVPTAPPVNRVADPRNLRARTVSDQATPFGCCNFFDACADEIYSLYYKGALDLLDWMGFQPTDDCYRSVEFLTYLRPEQSQGQDTAGHISDPCSDPNGVEYGSQSITVEDFGLYGRVGPNRNLFKTQRYCKTRPRYMLDGSVIQSETLWDMMFAMDQLLNDLRVDLVTGNAATPGQFDGLQQWVSYGGYGSGMLDSYVIDWAGNDLDGTGGGTITVNGTNMVGAYNLIDVLEDVVRNYTQRISWSPWLRNQQMQVGDMILVMPNFIRRCLLDYFACWSVCPGKQYEEVTKELGEVRDFRATLNGGMFGHGQIALDGITIPLLGYDWGMINGPTTGDIYFLTGSYGNMRIWEGEHISAQNVMDNLGALGLAENAGDYMSTDGGRVLVKADFDNLCAEVKAWMAPRLFCMAPWLQTRITDVVCRTPTGPLSPNPADTSFYPETSFDPAECP